MSVRELDMNGAEPFPKFEALLDKRVLGIEDLFDEVAAKAICDELRAHGIDPATARVTGVAHESCSPSLQVQRMTFVTVPEKTR